ncbi:MAG: hypothetical protein HY727_21380 [Candidatus Rokubacteria bacterium]|nr:hypothetical protein [Candidatus Rokubacteria bacterium]
MLSPLGTILVVLVIGLALAVIVWALFRAVPPVTRIVERTFWCPFRDLNVAAEFEEAAWDGKRFEVDRCTAFSPTSAVTCEKLCLHLAKLPSSRNGALTAARVAG